MLTMLVLSMQLTMSTPPLPRLPETLESTAIVIEAAEAALHAKVLPPGQRPGPAVIQEFVLGWVQGDRLPDGGRAPNARALRLAIVDDDALWCFLANGLRMAAAAMATVASHFDQKLEVGLRAEAGRMSILMDGRCGGPGGKAARREWDAIDRMWERGPAGDLHRVVDQPCIPVPMPGITACAPRREEVLRLTPTQMTLLAVALAAGIAAPALAELAIAGSVPAWAAWAAAGAAAVP